MLRPSDDRIREAPAAACGHVQRHIAQSVLVAVLVLSACTSGPGIGAGSTDFVGAVATQPVEDVQDLPTVAAEPSPALVATGSHPAPAPAPPEVRGPVGSNFDEQALADACFAGAMRQCDRLFDQSVAGSSAETYGATCGLRADPPGIPCAEVFLSEDVTLGRMLAEGVNVRTERSLDSGVLSQLVDSTGGMIPIIGEPVDGWYSIVHQFRRGWIFGAFVSPEVDGEVVVRTTYLDPIELFDASGLAVAATTGSFGLVIDQAGSTWTVQLPDGDTAFVNSSSVTIVAS